jgi:lipooligosaccharide transport system ATP-binding protein
MSLQEISEVAVVGAEVAVRAQNLSKKYDDFVAVDNISFEVFEGECCGFLGPNGAGKTTTVKMIHCVLPPASGELTVAGMSVWEDPRKIKKMTGVAPQEDNLDPDFSVMVNLLVYARYFDIPKGEAKKRSQELLRFIQLEEKRDVIIDKLSTGMKRRLILARALINEPRILLLDEPTTGLDPQARHLIWDRVRALKKQGVTIILTTHYMDEAAALCDRTLIMDYGKIIEEGRPTDLVKKHVGEDVLEVDFDEKVMTMLKEEFPGAQLEVSADRIHVFTDQPHGVFERFLKDFPTKGATIRNANLEDVFMKLTGRKLRE